MMLSAPAGSVDAFGTKGSPTRAGAASFSCLASDSEVCMVYLFSQPRRDMSRAPALRRGLLHVGREGGAGLPAVSDDFWRISVNFLVREAPTVPCGGPARELRDVSE